jgi:RimJ/RimL family protein N-acetyltransferase
MIVRETKRLRLKKLTLDDADFMFRLLNSPLFIQYIGDRGIHTLDDAQTYLTNAPLRSYEINGFGMYRVDLSETNEAIGLCGLVKREGLQDVDLGFAFLPGYEGRGYATEAAAEMLLFARDAFHLKRVVGITSPENLASIRVLEKIGMKYEGIVPLPREGDPVKLFGVSL